MAEQSPPKGKLSYKVNNEGHLRLVPLTKEHVTSCEVKDKYINARLENDKLVVRVGCTILIDNERTVNREFVVDPSNQDLEKALNSIFEGASDYVEQRALADAYEDIKLEDEDED